MPDDIRRPVLFQRLTFLNARGEAICEYLVADGADLRVDGLAGGWPAFDSVRLTWERAQDNDEPPTIGKAP